MEKYIDIISVIHVKITLEVIRGLNRMMNEKDQKWMNALKENLNCPTCNSKLISYRYNESGNEMTFRYACKYAYILSLFTNTKSTYGRCHDTKEWKALVSKRLSELQKLNDKVEQIITDERLKKEVTTRLQQINYDVKNWWDD